MLIEIYPKPDGMQHINPLFCEAEPVSLTRPAATLSL